MADVELKISEECLMVLISELGSKIADRYDDGHWAGARNFDEKQRKINAQWYRNLQKVCEILGMDHYFVDLCERMANYWWERDK